MGIDVSERPEDGLDLGPDDRKLPRLTRATSATHVRKIALEYAKAKRSHVFKRVSEDFLNAVEANARAFILSRVERHPSKGVTLT